MKKILLPLIIILLLTGCSKIDTETKDYKNIINSILINENKSVNTASVGYKYYIPIGVNITYDSDFNKELKIKNTKLVLYVDVISYHYKNKLNYQEVDKNVYYYSNIDGGYISIIKKENEYYLKMVHNYAKIESYVEEDELIDVIVYSTIILKNIVYNDVLIDNLIEEKIKFGDEITYKIDKPEDSKSKFSQYLQEYVQTQEEEKTNENEELPFEQD